ncbi:MAG: ATP-dependent DNA helicase [Planctomycetota bacterium]
MDGEIRIESVASFFAEKGPLARALSGYRPRPQQLAMAQAVARAADRGHHLVVEAGTGVGKSFGYLVPLILGPLTEGRRVLVSTQTLSLQDQLFTKDLPFLRGCLDLDFRAEVAKGRSNYLAPRRLERALAEARGRLGGEGLAEELERLRREIGRTREGTRQEILPLPWGEAWDAARSERHDCLGQECPHFDDDCWFHRARRRVFTADLVIVNHSLFFADLALRDTGNAVLPDYDVVVFDEAHGLEAAALSHFGARISRAQVLAALARLHRPTRGRGLLVSVPGSEIARAAVGEAARAAGAFFTEVALLCGREDQREIRGEEGLEDGLREPLAALSAELDALAKRQGDRGRQAELAYHSARIQELADATGRCLEIDEDRVHWVEKGAGLEDVALEMRPLEAGPLLRERLFDRVRSVVMTSATLSVGRSGGLAWVAKRLGVPEAEKLQLGSPFDFGERVRLRVPTWLDQPRDDEEWWDRASRAVLDYIERSQGGAFVLFTSYGAMQSVRRRIAGRLEQLGFPLLVQGDGLGRAAMLDRFREDERSVLLGADSFWQGVDVKGEGLRLVVIAKLPFPVPSLPINRARARRIEARGGNAFRELYLPEAIVRFKQGFGRLIRSEDDRGTVVVLDTRILGKSYGRSFLEALPSISVLED